jgi:hypothetical protein
MGEVLFFRPPSPLFWGAVFVWNLELKLLRWLFLSFKVRVATMYGIYFLGELKSYGLRGYIWGAKFRESYSTGK